MTALGIRLDRHGQCRASILSLSKDVIASGAKQSFSQIDTPICRQAGLLSVTLIVILSELKKLIVYPIVNSDGVIKL